MGRGVKDFVKETASRFGIGITTSGHLEELEDVRRAYTRISGTLEIGGDQAIELLKFLPASKSQLLQDIFVLSELGLKRDGFFVEFGATDGVLMSNTYLLEKKFAWKGILAEPARCWHRTLKSNRNCAIETVCVWRESNATLIFREVPLKALSTIDSFSSSDMYADDRKKGKKYAVATISLQDLLDKHKAPEVIDYLSIDTEGSEYEILSNFDFGKYRFRVITCEHYFSPKREQIFSLLTEKGYVRKCEQYSDYDDWYVDPRLI